MAPIKAVDRSVQLLKELAEADAFEENVLVGTIEDPVKTVSETLTHCNTLLGHRIHDGSGAGRFEGSRSQSGPGRRLLLPARSRLTARI